MPNIAFVNGKWMPLAAACVSVEDRGFQFGDGVYELIRVYDGQPFHLRAHLARLSESARQIGISSPYSIERLERIALTGCRRSGYRSAKIYIQITRGVAARIHHFPTQVKPTVVMTFRRLTPMAPEVRARGVSVMTSVDHRWGHCNIKSLNLLPNVMAREEAIQAGHAETLFIREGLVTEGAGSNVFTVIGGVVVTPPEGPAVLSGITREVVISVGQKCGVEVTEAAVTIEQLRAADEIFLTGTTIEILPVVRLDGEKVANGRPGSITRQLYAAFLKERVTQTFRSAVT